MSYTTNTKFMAALLKSQGTENNFPEKEMMVMMLYVETETRLAIETAIKYMRKDGRTELTANDIEMAAEQLGHGELPIAPLPPNRLPSKKQYHIS